MKYRKSPRGGGDVPPPSIKLDIVTDHPGSGGGVGVVLGSGSGGGGSAFFSDLTPTPGSGSVRGSYGSSSRSDPPEKKLTLLALRVAILEKAASGLGKLDFVWATVVLLGGFVGNLTLTDFWCITVILVGEALRVFSRSHELKWQHHATETSTAGGALGSSPRFFRRILHACGGGGGGRDDQEPPHQQRATPTTNAGAAAALCASCGRFFRRVVHALAHPAADGADVSGDAGTASANFQKQVVAAKKTRTGHAPNGVSWWLRLPGAGELFTSRNICWLFNCLQVIWALACVVLSVMRLWNHEFGDGGRRHGGGNMRPALLLFYTLALLEALLFLLEKAYFAWKFSLCNLLRHVSKECQLGDYGHVPLRRFFYDAYSRCVTGSIFDALKMDLVTFAEELILSDFLEEQLIGVHILEQFASKVDSAGDTLRKVGNSPRSVERLVEMLSWKRRDEVEVRRSAAAVVCKLAGKRQNALRLSAIPGAIESVMSLLHTGRSAAVSGTHPQPNGGAAAAGEGRDDYDYLPFNLLGLRILEELSRDHDNCGKISNARGLLDKIVDFTQASEVLLSNQYVPDSAVIAVTLALQVVKRLVSTTGNTGKAVRQGVADNVFAASNLRGILRDGHGQRHRELQKLAIDVLTWLAMDDGGKEAIMGTGGLVKILLSIFVGAEVRELGHGAGEALAMLALESEAGCAAIHRQADVLQLVSALQDAGDDPRHLYAARVLRSLCAYSGPEHRERLRVVTKALPVVLGVTMTQSDEEVLEACVGLTTQICRFIDGDRFAAELRGGAGVEERAYVQRLATILRENKYPKVRIPRMRRFVVQQVIWLMTMTCSGARGYMELLRGVGMEGLLESIAETTSELESYHVFSGSVGIGKHRESFPGIVDYALELIKGGGGGVPAEE